MIRAVKMWFYEEDRIYSMTVRRPSTSPSYGWDFDGVIFEGSPQPRVLPYRWMPGTNVSPDVVEQDNHRGFFAYKSFRDMVSDPLCCYKVSPPNYAYQPFVWGSVLLSGTVAFHESGYRAQKAEIELFSLPDTSPSLDWEGNRLVSKLAKSFGVPLLDHLSFTDLFYERDSSAFEENDNGEHW